MQRSQSLEKLTRASPKSQIFRSPESRAERGRATGWSNGIYPPNAWCKVFLAFLWGCPCKTRKDTVKKSKKALYAPLKLHSTYGKLTQCMARCLNHPEIGHTRTPDTGLLNPKGSRPRKCKASGLLLPK